MTEQAQYRVSAWMAEFHDARVERDFREHVQAETARYVQWTVLAAGVFFSIFALTDFLNLGKTPEAWLLLVIRGSTALAALAVFWWVIRMPHVAVNGVAVTLFEAWVLVAFAVVVKLRDPSLGVDGMSMVTLLSGIYLLIPNRLINIVILSLCGSAGFFLLEQPRVGGDSQILVDMLMLVLLMNLFGFAAARRLAIVRREQFRLLARSEDANASLQQEVERRRTLETELAHLASTDPLTELPNRRHYLELSRRTLEHAQRHGRMTAVMILDMDHFKHINDTWGHAAGDAALQRVAVVLREELRTSDIPGRLGGEEFAVTLPEVKNGDAERTAIRLRDAIAGISLQSWPRMQLSVTVGIAVDSQHGTMERLLMSADGALYAGKRAGRGRVRLDSPGSV